MKVSSQLYFIILLMSISTWACNNSRNSSTTNSANGERFIAPNAEGLLIGSALGDAAGGPVEFIFPPERTYWSGTNEKLSTEGIEALATLFTLRAYPPEAEPYAQFEPYAPAGSVTDDTRWKMILFNCMKEQQVLSKENFAKSYWDFSGTIPDKYDSICSIWQKEYGFVMNNFTGSGTAYPIDRVWGGIPTMAGQMPFLPIAILYPGNPEAAYIATWEINCIDVGYAKDITSVIVAGLSKALEDDASWPEVIEAMIETDPYNFSNVPWVPRKSSYWIKKSHEMVIRSEGVVKNLYQLIELESEATTWWDAHIPLLVSLAFLEITEYNALAALQLFIEFGHDNDSYAQVVGAFAGAMYGKEIFDPQMVQVMNTLMKEQYNQDINDWMKILSAYE